MARVFKAALIVLNFKASREVWRSVAQYSVLLEVSTAATCRVLRGAATQSFQTKLNPHSHLQGRYGGYALLIHVLAPYLFVVSRLFISIVRPA